ncbi:MAG: hypothetical protein ACI8VE_000160 [Natrialbaceae archaeon]|jgi:hypothetical protein
MSADVPVSVEPHTHMVQQLSIATAGSSHLAAADRSFEVVFGCSRGAAPVVPSGGPVRRHARGAAFSQTKSMVSCIEAPGPKITATPATGLLSFRSTTQYYSTSGTVASSRPSFVLRRTRFGLQNGSNRLVGYYLFSACGKVVGTVARHNIIYPGLQWPDAASGKPSLAHVCPTAAWTVNAGVRRTVPHLLSPARPLLSL